MTPTEFSKAVAKVLKAEFPALGTQREMGGADTIDALVELYARARTGLALPGGPATSGKLLTPSQHASRIAATRWARATEADREKSRANGRKGGRPKKAPLG